MQEEKRAALADEFRPYDDLIPLLMEKTGRNFTEDPLLFQSFFDLLKSTVSSFQDNDLSLHIHNYLNASWNHRMLMPKCMAS